MKKIPNTVRYRSRLFSVGLYAILVFSVASCGLDFEVDDSQASVATGMSIGYDTVYVMRGDTLTLRPVIKPDTVNIRDVFISSSDPSVVSINPLTGKLEAVGKGWAKIHAISVSSRLQDSCSVCVMNPWEPANCYPYETIFYATVTIGGKPLSEGMTVAAFVNEECRGIGQELTFHGVKVMQLRVGSEKLVNTNVVISPPDDDDEFDDTADDDGPTVVREKIMFLLYDKNRLKLYYHFPSIEFDGETHGTLSNLYKIDF